MVVYSMLLFECGKVLGPARTVASIHPTFSILGFERDEV
jgi:hypothetical protein